MTASANTLPQDPSGRRRYVKPTLTEHGQLAELTRVVGGVWGSNDMAKRGNKTGF